MSLLLSTIFVGENENTKRWEVLSGRKGKKFEEKLAKAKDYLFEIEYDPSR